MGPRRRQPRYRTQHLRIDDPVSGRVLNVGQRGLALETPERLFVGGSHFFRIGLGSKQLRLSGNVQWCRLVGTETCSHGEVKPVFQAGVSFSETTTSRAWREALKRLTETHSPTLEEVAVASSYQVRTGDQPARKLRLTS